MADQRVLCDPVELGHQAALDRLADECACPICHVTVRNVHGPRVLSAVQPVPGESLMGLVTRCARQAHLGTTAPLLAAGSAVWHAHKNLAVREDVDFGNLAFAARLAPHEVEQRRYARVEILRGFMGVRFHGATVPPYDLRMNVRRLVPASLGDAPRHAALGHHGLVTHCPDSGQILIDRCPRCQAKLAWSKPLIERCDGCGCDLREQRVASVTDEVRAATRLMIDLVHPDPARHEVAIAMLPPPLACLDRGATFELGWRMGCVITGRSLAERDRALVLPVEERLPILAAGSTALARWPDSVTDALGSRHDEKRGASTSLALGIRMIARAQNAWPAVSDAILAAAPGLNLSTATAVKSAMPGSVRGTEVQQALGISRGVFRRLRGTTGLVPMFETGQVHKLQVFSASHIDEVRSQLDDRISLSTACQVLGISRHGVEQLCCLNELEFLDHDLAREVLQQRHVRRSSVTKLVARLRKATRPLPIDGAVPLRRAMLTVGGRQKPWGPAIAALAAGAIRFDLEGDATDLLVEHVAIAASDVHLLSALEFDPRDHPDCQFDNIMKREDAEELLNLSPRQFQEALADRQVGEGDGLPYDRARIETLAKEFISGGEIIMRWCGGGKRKPAAFRGPRRLRRASRLGWIRRDVDQAMADERPFYGCA